MRIAVLTAAAVLLAGGASACSSAPVATPTLTPIPPKGGTSSPGTSAHASPSTPGTSTRRAPSSPVPTAAPTAATPIETVVAWVEAGEPADPAAYHTATRDGADTHLGSDVAFVTPTGAVECMTEEKTGDALACLVDLRHPPAQPEDAYGHWMGGWTDFDGSTLAVGSAHGDPGRFAAGRGAELPYGSSLRFGDYQCRSDPDGLFCVNFARLSGAKFADSGVVPFGCLRKVDDSGFGLKFTC